jgi:hypothetical protein
MGDARDDNRPSDGITNDGVTYDKEGLSKVNGGAPIDDTEPTRDARLSSDDTAEIDGGSAPDTDPQPPFPIGDDAGSPSRTTNTDPPKIFQKKSRARLATAKRVAVARGEKVSQKMVPLEVTDRNAPPKDPRKAWPEHRTSHGFRAADYDDPKYTEITPMVVTAFMAALSVSGRATQVAKELRLDYMLIVDLRKHDPDFKQRYEEAMHAAFDHQEDEVRRRAFDGYERPVYQMGKLIGTETVYSDALAMTMLKAERPEKYNPKTIQTIEHAGAVGMVVAAMTDDEINDAINKKLRFLGALPMSKSAEAFDVTPKSNPEDLVQQPPLENS